MSDRVSTLLGIALSSEFDPEAETALRKLRALLKAEGVTPGDITAAVEHRHQLGKVAELVTRAKAVIAERDAALAEVDRLKRANGHNSFATALWSTPGMPATVENRHALWVLDLVA